MFASDEDEEAEIGSDGGVDHEEARISAMPARSLSPPPVPEPHQEEPMVVNAAVRGVISPRFLRFLRFDPEAEMSEVEAAPEVQVAPEQPEQLHEAERPPALPRAPLQQAGLDILIGAKSFSIGPFRFTYQAPSNNRKHGGWQARCPYHRLSAVTECKKAAAMRSNSRSAALEILKVLMNWCALAREFERKRTHAAWVPREHDMMPIDVLRLRLEAMESPEQRPLTDAELDALAPAPLGGAPEPRARRAPARRARAKAASESAAEPSADRSSRSSSSGDKSEDSSNSSAKSSTATRHSHTGSGDASMSGRRDESSSGSSSTSTSD